MIFMSLFFTFFLNSLHNKTFIYLIFIYSDLNTFYMVITYIKLTSLWINVYNLSIFVGAIITITYLVP